jgi:hypothetical protein
MPVLNRKKTQEFHESSEEGRAARFLSVCANPTCPSGWLQVWRSRATPVLEGGWSCSSGCTRARLAHLMRREGEQRNLSSTAHRHRIPIGLVLLKKGWISQEQLKRALDEQRAGKAGRIGTWLMEHCGLDERRLTQALGIQWNCPVFSDDVAAGPEISPVPRLFMEAFRFFPMQLSSAGVLYIAFEDRINHSVTLAIERVTGFRVEAGLVDGSGFEREHRARLEHRFFPTRIIEAGTMDSLLRALTSLIEKEKPHDTRVVRIHDFYWLRLSKESSRSADSPRGISGGVEDVICSLAAF